MEALVVRLVTQRGRCLSNYCCSSRLYNHRQQHGSCSWVSYRSVPLSNSIALSSCYSSSDYLLRLTPVSAVLSSTVVSPEAEYDDGIASLPVGGTDPPKSVQVKFVLQKNCLFGQHFLVVGDNPMLGLWDPANAIALEWSEGHIWTAELDLPVDETVQFKFILRGLSGRVDWQPGPDRILQTWDTNKTIIVTEEWANAANQKIIEEDKSIVWAEEATVTEENNEHTVLSHDTRISDTQGSMGAGALQNEWNLTDDGDFLLVPGLTLTSISRSAVEIQEVASSDVTFGSDLAKDNNSVQLPEEEKNEAASEDKWKEETVKSIQVNGDCSEEFVTHVQVAENFDSKEENCRTTSSALKNDLHWGRKVVENLLYNLGFTVS